MWLPNIVYERIPQFWFLLGLLFITTGLYLGYESDATFYYLGLGVVSCTYGVGIFMMRWGYRQSQRQSDQPTANVDQPTANVE